MIVLTGPSDDDAITRCKDLHAYYVHKSDDTWDDLEPLIFEILMSTPEPRIVAEAQPTTSPRVLLVDDDPVGLRTLTQELQKYHCEVIQGSNGMQGFRLALKRKPDPIVTDYDMDHGSGNYLPSRVKTTGSTKHVPVVIRTSTPLEKGLEHAIHRELIDRGAAAFIARPLDVTSLVAEARRYIALPVYA